MDVEKILDAMDDGDFYNLVTHKLEVGIEIYHMSNLDIVCQHLRPLELEERITRGRHFSAFDEYFVVLYEGRNPYFESFSSSDDPCYPIGNIEYDRILEAAEKYFEDLSNYHSRVYKEDL